MINSLRKPFLVLLITSIVGCGTIGAGLADMAEITKEIEASSECKVSKAEQSIRNGDESASVEIKDCEVADAVAEADRLNQKLLADVPSYKKLDGFTFVFINDGVRQSIEFKGGKRDKK